MSLEAHLHSTHTPTLIRLATHIPTGNSESYGIDEDSLLNSEDLFRHDRLLLTQQMGQLALQNQEKDLLLKSMTAAFRQQKARSVPVSKSVTHNMSHF